MWCFCRKKSSAVDDEQDEADEGFVKVASDEIAESKCIALRDEPETDASPLKNEKSVEDGCLNELFETKSYNSGILGISDYVNVSAIGENSKKEQTGENSPFKNNLKVSSQIKPNSGVVRAIVHSPYASNIDSSESSNFGSRKKLIANEEKKLIASDGKKLIVECKSLFSSHSTQTENGVLPAPLMKRREKTKSTEMTENLIFRNSNVPLDLSSKAVSPVRNLGVCEASNHSKASTNTTDSYHYENLPSGVQAALEVVESRKDLSHPLDLSLSGQCSSNIKERRLNSLSNSDFESCPLNLSKKSFLPNCDKDSYFGDSRFNSTNMSSSSLRSNETESCVTGSSKPDLLSNVDDDDDYSVFDKSKINYTDASYDNARSNHNINFQTASASSDCNKKLIQLNSFPKGFGQEQGDWYMVEPQLAHSSSYVHQKKGFPSGQYRYHHSQQFHQSHSHHEPAQQQSSALSRYQSSHTDNSPFTNPVTFKRDLSCSSSFHSVTNQSIGISYCNPSYQNFSLDKESQYAVLDAVQSAPVYNNLAPCAESLYHIYDDKTGTGSTQVIYENISPEPENLYFAYDNNTYIPPHRLKKKENMYENQVPSPDPAILADRHTYSTIGSEMTKSSSRSELAVQLVNSDISCNDSKVIRDISTSVDSCASKSVKESTSEITALNLVKPPDIPLPVKVKPSPKTKHLSKQFKSNNNCANKNGKLSNGKTSNNSKGKSKELIKKEVNSIPEILKSPSSQGSRSVHQKPPNSKQKGKKLSLTSLSNAPRETPQKVAPSFDVSSKKFSSLTDMEKKDSLSSLLPSPNAQNSKKKSARSLLASLSFRGEKKPSAIKKSESSKLLGSRNKWGDSSAASLGSIASLASSSSSLSNYVHPPSIASEGGILSSDRKDFYDNGNRFYYTPPCLAAHPSDRLMQENFKLLKQCPWYWGALDVRRAEEVLSGRADGSFLVRDSSDDSCIISLSFRSLQTTHHTRVEYNDGFLSFHIPSPITQESQRLNNGHSPSITSSASSASPSTGHCSIVEFIAKAIEDSTQSCNNLSINNTCWLYLERPMSPGVERVPVKLFSPVSKVQDVSSRRKPACLQHIARRKIVSMTKKEFISSLALSHYLRAYLLIDYISVGPIN